MSEQQPFVDGLTAVLREQTTLENTDCLKITLPVGTQVNVYSIFGEGVEIEYMDYYCDVSKSQLASTRS